PDGSVVDVAFVHRRLSILDHEGGHQPMVHDGERLRPDLTYQPGEPPKLAHELCPDKPLVAVVFNGCIYNQHELRTELAQQGVWFETDHSDTEVLVHGWRRWGLRIVDELDGMNGTLVWCRNTGQVAWGQDLAGEKPLYSTATGRVCARVWSSSITHLASFETELMSSESLVDLAGLEYWIKDGSDWIPAIYAYANHPGEWSICPESPRQGAVPRDPRYKSTPLRSISYKPALVGRGHRPGRDLRDKRHARYVIERAVSSRLESDVPLGVFLSGGIDSGLIAAVAKKELPDLKTFTVRMPDARFDESEAAAETAKAIGTKHTTLECHPDPAGDLVHLIEQLGLPFGDSSLLPTYWLCKAAREHITVALSGDGGDELFGGYRRHTITPMLNRWHRVLRLIPDRLLDRRTPGSRGEYLSRLAVAARYEGYPELLA
ncbi:MAG: asparagine synthase-related protein, partial [Planctomycetota bacterium]